MGTMVVGVRFRRASKLYYFAPGGFPDLQPGDEVIVETSRGRELGRVIVSPHEVDDAEIVGDLKSVERRATPEDRLDAVRYQRREAGALRKCREQVTAHELPMKVVSAEYNYDGTRLVFSFTAEKRVDFRELVRDLAKVFEARIELRQIGVRDECKLIGGAGSCGRPLCCQTWLTEFNPVSIKMAKHQGLPLSPMEISGVCGRLLCCLGFEDQYYVETKARLPKVGELLLTPEGVGKVVSVNALKESVNVQLESEAIIEVPAEEVKRADQAQAAAAQAAPQADAEPEDDAEEA